MPRFENLTEAQEEALSQIAMLSDGGGMSRKVLAALEARGLIEGYDETLPGFPPVTIRRYQVPIDVHMRWCAWCAEHTTVPEAET